MKRYKNIAIPVELCGRNVWHIQGNRMKEFSGLWHYIIPVMLGIETKLLPC